MPPHWPSLGDARVDYARCDVAGVSHDWGRTRVDIYDQRILAGVQVLPGAIAAEIGERVPIRRRADARRAGRPVVAFCLFLFLGCKGKRQKVEGKRRA